MLRPLHGIVLAAGLTVLVGCGSEEQETAAGGDTLAVAADTAVSSVDTIMAPDTTEFGFATYEAPGVAPAPTLSLLRCASGQNLGSHRRTVTSAGTSGQPLTAPGRQHKLEIAAGAVPAKAGYDFQISDVAGDSTGCQVIVRQLDDGRLEADDAFTLRIRCSPRQGNRDHCTNAVKVIRLDDGTQIDPVREGQGANIFYRVTLDSLSTYALASPEGFGQ